ncbi:MAG: response regulator [Myxococcota bacterium]|nr:response regulator [Myxococcota bacterium]
MSSNHKILVVEDDPLVAKVVERMLLKGNYSVSMAGDAEQAKSLLAEDTADLILLDWVLPRESGIDFLEWLKDQPRSKVIPVVMMTSKSKEAEVLKGFASGVDDYVRKPFSSRELLARVKAVLRRTSRVDEAGMIEAGDLQLNVHSRALFIAGEQVALTPIGYGLLLFFLRSPGRVHARDALREAVWGSSVHVAPRTIDVHIASLRNALRPSGHDHLLETRHGAGYLFRLPESPSETPEAEPHS